MRRRWRGRERPQTPQMETPNQMTRKTRYLREISYIYSELRVRHVHLGSGILIDSGSNNSNRREEGNKFCPTFFVATSIEIYFIFQLIVQREIFGLVYKEFWYFYPKNCHSAHNNMGLGSEKSLFQILDPGVIKSQDPQCCFYCLTVLQSGKGFVGWIRMDPGSVIRKRGIPDPDPDPGVKRAVDPDPQRRYLSSSLFPFSVADPGCYPGS
jgi:hypothetical protein